MRAVLLGIFRNLGLFCYHWYFILKYFSSVVRWKFSIMTFKTYTVSTTVILEGQ